MAGRYIQINREKLEGFLTSCGFSRRQTGKELVYVRPHKYHADVWIKVYTSLPISGGRARAKGKDAIRVTVAYENDEVPFRGRTSFGIFKATRTFRTGSDEAVRERLYARMQEAYEFASEWLRQNWEALKRARVDADKGPGPGSRR